MNTRDAYFQYLKDPSVPVPYTTAYDRITRNENELLAGQPQENSGNDQIHNEQQENEQLNMEVDEFRQDNLHNREILNQNGLEDEHDIYDDDESEQNMLNQVAVGESYENLFHDDVESGENEENEEDNEPQINVELHENPNNAHVMNNREDRRNEERIPIYPGALLTKEESNLLIMSFMIRHNLSDIALEDLLELIDCHVPRTLNVSKYKFLKEFPNTADIKTFYYCPNCLILLNFGTVRCVTCTSCRKIFLQNSLKRNGHFFLHIPLKDQLSSLFSGTLFNELQRDCPARDILSDVTSGRVHKMLRKKGIISNYDISLQWNADGVQTFKSSKVSMCPLQVSINELNYRLRKENILLAGMWAATEKPVLNLFLKSFIDELKDLHANGFECLPPNFDEPITVKVHTILAPVDSVERCALQNIHQFNGRYGCSLCLNPSEHVPLGNGYTRVYRGGEGIKRTKSQHRRDAIKAETEDTVVNGVKGVSLPMLLPVFNIIRSFPPEYMHCVLLGVVKLFLLTWIDPKNCRKPWYIGTKSQILDNRLSEIFPPCEITRTPQSVSNISQWKASEFKNFLIYYSLPCLKDLLPSVFYKHWFLLVYAINIFDSDKIETQAYENATRAIKKFVSNTEILYGMEQMKFNMHLLLHIPKSVNDFGALWAWSAFPYESYNFVLRSMLHNSQTILQQICKSYLRFQTVKYIDTFSKANCSVEAKNLYLKMLGNYRNRTGHRTIDDNRLIIWKW